MMNWSLRPREANIKCRTYTMPSNGFEWRVVDHQHGKNIDCVKQRASFKCSQSGTLPRFTNAFDQQK